MIAVDGTWRCYLCTVIAQLPQPVAARDLQKRDRAELRPSPVRADLSAPHAAAEALAFKKRHRVGPHR